MAAPSKKVSYGKKLTTQTAGGNVNVPYVIRVRWFGGSHTPIVAQNTTTVLGFGDVVVPKPDAAEYPTILDLPAPCLRGYSRESAVAEKFEAMVKLGVLNSRVKDFFDIWLLSRQYRFRWLDNCPGRFRDLRYPRYSDSRRTRRLDARLRP